MTTPKKLTPELIKQVFENLDLNSDDKRNRVLEKSKATEPRNGGTVIVTRLTNNSQQHSEEKNAKLG